MFNVALFFPTAEAPFRTFSFERLGKKKMARWRFLFLFFHFSPQKPQLFFINKREEKAEEKALLCILAGASLPVLLFFTAFFSCFFSCQNVGSLFPNTLTADIQPVVSGKHMLLNESLDLAGNCAGKMSSCPRSNICWGVLCVLQTFYFTMCLSLSVSVPTFSGGVLIPSTLWCHKGALFYFQIPFYRISFLNCGSKKKVECGIYRVFCSQ